MASKKKLKKFDLYAVVREMARERVGQPRPVSVRVDKRSEKRKRVQSKELKEERY